MKKFQYKINYRKSKTICCKPKTKNQIKDFLLLGSGFIYLDLYYLTFVVAAFFMGIQFNKSVVFLIITYAIFLSPILRIICDLIY